MKTKTIAAWLIVLLLTLQVVTALGIRPAKTTILSEETSNFDGELWVVNEEGREFEVNIYVEGPLEDYIKPQKKKLKFDSEDEYQVLKFKVNLPDNVPPGTSINRIVIEEALESEEPNVVSSKILLKHKVIIEGSYPDKYITAKVNFHDNGNKVSLVSEVENLGRENIENIQTTFYVNDKEQENSYKTESASLKKQENKLLKTELDKELYGEGEFKVSAVTTYDDFEIEVIKELRIGEPKVEITYFDKYFIANKINPYSLDLLNKWNKLVKNVFVDVEVKKDNEKIDEFRTRSVDIEAEMTERINDYMDAEKKGPGEYTFEMIVNYWNIVRMEQSKFKFESELVSEKEFNKLTGGFVNSLGSSTFLAALAALAAILACGLVIWFAVIKKGGNGSKKEYEP